ncbi:hypothetical protein [Pedobacter psychroterrae]|uniref:HMA domain-containing protein n=1 Tax=Pedobacter psychroterrae TaxID=2530453 RepID=A0A4R0NQV8_9SPHI|nr:hypothetical protein [Pedobacter psychroterrae]TCD03196.1 hypothetical protein EZ437_04270 [Pedobacter psychroterrae]
MIMIFKTNVTDTTDVEALKPQLDKCLIGARWNFDLEDCDKILRVDSISQISETVIKLLQENGFCCEELLF